MIAFWYEFASTYSYLAASRIDAVAGAAGVRVAWRPFLLGPVFAAQGMNDSPFNLYPVKGAYMWRDMERLCARYGLPFRRPSAFPRNGLAAARIATALNDPAAFSRAVFHANFAEDQDIADTAVLSAILAGLDLDPEAVLARSRSPEVKERLRARTAEAQALGIFGAPSFVAGGELFWGNDRLEQALEWGR